jgi:Flp pilus assembly protein CpaB
VRSRPLASVDALTAALIVGGCLLLAAAIVSAIVLVRPPAEPRPAALSEPTPLPADHVATVLRVDPAAGAVNAARVGDHVDVLGYFSRQVTGVESVTRLLIGDVAVLAIARDGGATALTLAVPADTALLLQQAQAMGAKPFVVLRSATDQASRMYPVLTDTSLAQRLAGTSGKANQPDGQ